MVQRACELFVLGTVHPITRIVEEQYPDLRIGGQGGKPRALASECLAFRFGPPRLFFIERLSRKLFSVFVHS
jgi:hypothetical protein